MRFFILSLATFLIYSSIAFAQDKGGTYKEKFTQGDLLLLEENYAMAMNNFLDAYNIDSSSANINYKVGLCYLKSVAEKKKAIHYLEKAALNMSDKYVDFETKETKAPLITYYYLAQAYHLNFQFNLAIETFQKFKSLNPKEPATKEIDRQIELSNNAIGFYKNPANVVISNMGDSVNSSYPDYSPVLSADESTLIFTSKRPGNVGGQNPNGQYYEDIYICYRKPDKTWTEPVSIGPNINTNSNEATISLSADGQQLFIYKDSNGGDIYYSTLEGDNWTTPVKMTSDINTLSWETHACLSADGNLLYFVSDRKGGYGGRDIYRCVILPNGKWSLATNLGPSINTEFDEDSPFIHPDGVTLFFSSKGYKNMGGFDIFYSVKNEDGAWATPVNMGYPINTPDDDIFYVASVDGKRAYYSSAIEGGIGEKDIYLIKLFQPVVDTITLLKGYLKFEGSGTIPSSDIKIIAKDVETGLIVQNTKPNSKTGKYILALITGSKGKTYEISYECEGYQPITETLKIEPGSAYQEIEKEVELKQITFESKDKTQKTVDKPKEKGKKPIKKKK